MSTFKTIARNTVWLTIAELVNTVMFTVGGIMLARSLGDVGYGQYGFALSFVSLFAIFTEFGINLLFINEVTQNRSLLKDYFTQLLGLKIGLGVMFFVIMFVAIQLTGKAQEIKVLVYYLSISLIISALTTLCAAVIRVHEQMRYEAYFRIASGAATFAIVVLTFLLNLGYLRFAQYSTIANLAILVAYLAFVRRQYISFNIGKNWQMWRTLLVRSIPLGLSIIFVSIYYNLGSVMLSFWTNDQTVGWYNADSKLILLLITFINLYYSAVYPVISRLITTQLYEAQHIIHISVKIMITMLVPIAVGATMLAAPLLKLFYGHEFTPGAPALQVLIWTAVIMSIGTMYGFTLIVAGKRSIYMWCVALGAVVNVVINLMLIPRFSTLGAAIGTVTAELTVLILTFAATNRFIVKTSFTQYLPKPAAAGIAMAVPLWLLSGLNVMILVGIGAVTYVGALLLIRGITGEELAAVRGLFRKDQPVRNTEHENWY